jgi:hypothetical protein
VEKIELNLPIRLVSESNCSEHWSKKAKRHKTQQWLVKHYLNDYDLSRMLPCTITLTRRAARNLDDDNLVGAFKWIRDQVAACLIPGKRPGMADSDPRIKWLYAQEIQSPGGIRIRLEKSFATKTPHPEAHI